MRHEEDWRPTKYLLKNGRLRVSRDKREVCAGSRLTGDLVAALYQEHLPNYCKGDLLDLGCGKAPLYQTCKPLVRSYTCVDWEDSLHPSPHVDKHADLTHKLPFEASVFDTILLSDVLEHIPNPGHLLSEMHRILRSAGHVLMNVPFLYPLHEHPHDYYRYTRFALRRLAEETGFSVLLLEETGGILEVLADLVSKAFTQLPVLGDLLAAMLQSTVLRFTRSSVGHSLRQKSAHYAPLGYFLVMQK